jgi:hypothetical protein
MRVIHTGPEHRPHVEPVFEDVTIREGGTEATPESGASATNGVGARSGADANRSTRAARLAGDSRPETIASCG